MDKLKSDIEIIDWLNSLEWIEEVIVSRVEIVGKIGLRTNSMDKQIFNLMNTCMDNRYYIEQPKAIAKLVHKSTQSIIPVYKPLNWFQRLMIRWCFGLKYERIN